jgi:hypothetical protein
MSALHHNLVLHIGQLHSAAACRRVEVTSFLEAVDARPTAHGLSGPGEGRACG